MAAKIGIQFQQAFGEALKGLPKAYPLAITDTRSAGNWQSEKPGDWLMAYKGQVLLFECKASEKFVSLRDVQSLRNFVKDHQVAKHRRWMETGNPAFFPFYSELTGRVEFWDSRDLVRLYQNERVSAKGLGEPLVICPMRDLQWTVATLPDRFKEKHHEDS